MKKQEQNMHSEHGIGPADNEATALVSGPTVDQEAIALLAYFYWEARGCPQHSPHEDWFRAEAELRNRVTAVAAV